MASLKISSYAWQYKATFTGGLFISRALDRTTSGTDVVEHGNESIRGDWSEQRNITLKVDQFTLGVVCLIAAVAVFVWARKCVADRKGASQ